MRGGDGDLASCPSEAPDLRRAAWELIDHARIDLCVVGGLTEALKIAHWAETHYIDIAPHNPLGPVAAAACVSLCMATSNVGAAVARADRLW